jgi:hypothetical protein
MASTHGFMAEVYFSQADRRNFHRQTGVIFTGGGALRNPIDVMLFWQLWQNPDLQEYFSNNASTRLTPPLTKNEIAFYSTAEFEYVELEYGSWFHDLRSKSEVNDVLRLLDLI